MKWSMGVILVVLAMVVGCAGAGTTPKPTIILEFRELNEESIWVPSTGIVVGEELILSSRYFKENTYVDVDQLGRPLLLFEWDETGQELSEQITSRLVGKQMAIYIGDEPLRGEDGHPIAPVVQETIRQRGQITGLSMVDAQELSALLNASIDSTLR